MKIKLNTATFQNMVAKAVKGVGGNNNLFITQLMAIRLQENTLTLITTNGEQYLYINEPKIAGDDFYVVVPADKFSKLISKQTCEDITLEIPSAKKGQLDTLVVRGNGKYTIELPYDEDGELIEFPDPLAEVIDGDDSGWSKGEVNLSTIRLLLQTAKAALMLGTEAPWYTGYYAGERVVTTDTYKICGVDVEIFEDPKLIPAELMDLLDVMSEEKINIDYNDETLIFSTGKETVYGNVLEGIDEWQIDAINSILDEKYASSCKIEKALLLQMLERIGLFVDVFDKNSVYLTFTKDGLEVASKKGSGSEVIPYRESENFKDFTCCLDIELFKSQVKANQSDVVEILYGKDTNIKIVQGNTKQIIALADDDRFSEDE